MSIETYIKLQTRQSEETKIKSSYFISILFYLMQISIELQLNK